MSSELSTNTHNKTVDILDSIDLKADHQTVLERYYTSMYCTQIGDLQIDHHCVLFHSNRICILTLAPTHPIIKGNKQISRIHGQVTDSIDRMKNTVSGKGKRGGQKLMPDSTLCIVECEDGTSYHIFSCIKGKLIEMNENLAEKPNLLLRSTKTKGHLAIILSDLSTVEMCKGNMLTEQDYNKKFNSEL